MNVMGLVGIVLGLLMMGLTAFANGMSDAPGVRMPQKPGAILFGAGVLLLVIGIARATDAPILPDPTLTPGAVASTDEAEVCGIVGGKTYSQRHRVWTHRADTMRKYGIDPHTPFSEVEDDDRVPVCLGGDNASPLNHWAMRAPEYHAKDRAEAEVCRRVCRHHTMTLQAGQAIFLAPDWRDGYRQVFGTPPGN